MAVAPDWDDLRFLLAATRAATLTEAARALRVSGPTVGRRLRALEEALAVPLFEPGSSPPVLTDAGRAIVAVAEDMEDRALELPRVAERRTGVEGRPVRITAIGSVALFLVRHFDALRRRAGGAEIEVLATGERLSLARNEADIALRMGRVPRSGRVTTRRIARIAYALYCSEAFQEHNRPDDEAALATTQFIGYRKNPRRQSQSAWLYAFGSAGRFPLRVNDLQLRYEAARTGLGVTLLPCHLGDSGDGLVRLIAPPPELTEDVFLLQHERSRAVPEIKRVAAALTAICRERRGELLGAD